MTNTFLNPEVENPGLRKTTPQGRDSGGSNGSSGSSSGKCSGSSSGNNSEVFTGSIARLRRFLCRLKQAPQLRCQDIGTFLRSLLFVQSEADPNTKSSASFCLLNIFLCPPLYPIFWWYGIENKGKPRYGGRAPRGFAEDPRTGMGTG